MAFWAEIISSNAKNYQGMLTFSEHPDIFHKSMMRDLRKPLENMLKSLPAELLAEINGNTRVEITEALQGAHNTVKPQDLACFAEVAEAIGREAAIVELQKILNDSDIMVYHHKGLWSAFGWEEAPQGYDYWWDVYHNINPNL